MRKNIFTQRMVGVWNSLSGRVVEVGNLTTFKKHMDEHLNVLTVQTPSAKCWKMD